MRPLLKASFSWDEATDRIIRSYEWTGDPRAPICIDERTLPHLPWPMARVSTTNHATRSAYFLRLDVPGAWWRRHAHRARFWWMEWLTPRVVFTCELWGLAHVPPGEIPRWRHIGRRRPPHA